VEVSLKLGMERPYFTGGSPTKILISSGEKREGEATSELGTNGTMDAIATGPKICNLPIGFNVKVCGEAERHVKKGIKKRANIQGKDLEMQPVGKKI